MVRQLPATRRQKAPHARPPRGVGFARRSGVDSSTDDGFKHLGKPVWLEYRTVLKLHLVKAPPLPFLDGVFFFVRPSIPLDGQARCATNQKILFEPLRW